MSSDGARPRLLVVDNYDSFTFNLVQELGVLGADVEVVRNDQVDLAALDADLPDGVVISPGPGTPDDSGQSMDVLAMAAGRVPLLGVCLGHQCIVAHYGGAVVHAPELVHGKTSLVYHRGGSVFAGISSPFDATRYHSLVARRDDLPSVLRVTAETSDGVVMGVSHREVEVHGVQFHPESILTGSGRDLLANFLAMVRAASPTPAAASA
ncbi:anthranilate synthase component II [Salsipaludibacter albus]|uniref:anthranilate synthase component II n=1 Tax=Salsipaludibacter albus TaxID=2849650 RepID=UPI001EE4D8D3|nr:aminodeoxychorismate/anthranilate synthase component II [Salsipaludibacter albus]MBY5163999.1 aminodeoxychorismate/anthranilate synthase component II [Salsipaludibacter albus]